MRKVLVPVLLAVAIGGMLSPASALAKHVTAFGSLEIAKCANVECSAVSGLTTEFNGFALIANPGLEKTITFQLPPFTFPVAVNTDTDNPGDSDLNTMVVLVNVSGSSQKIKLTLLDANGTPVALTTDVFTVDPNHTVSLSLSSLLP